MNTEDLSDFHYWRASDLHKQKRPTQALAHLDVALEVEPRHIMASILAGEIHLFDADEIGLEDAEALAVALAHFEQALTVEPASAYAWSLKSLALFYSGRFAEALSAAEQGLNVLPLRRDFGAQTEETFTNIAESLYDCKVRALYESGRTEEAYEVLDFALEQYPFSSYLLALSTSE